MARENALTIYVDDDTKDQLAELTGQVIDSIQKDCLSQVLKNDNYSGDPTTGTVVIDRFKNAELSAKGTARTNGAGTNIVNSGKVTINVNDDKEIVEEIAKKDLALYGVVGIAQKRQANYIARVKAYLDNAFFGVAESEGTEVEITTGTIVERLEKLIQAVETTTNDWVDGVDRDDLILILNPETYGKAMNYINSIPATGEIGGVVEMFHKVRTYSNHRQDMDAIVMRKGSIGQLVLIDDYDMEKIGLDNNYALEMFVSSGTKAVTPDLIAYVEDIEAQPTPTPAPDDEENGNVQK